MTTPEPEAAEVERDETRESFAEALASWGLTPEQVADTLEATAFGLGLVELRPPEGQPSPGIAIVVDDRRDPELRALFADREQAGEEAEVTVEVADGPHVRVVLGPQEQALVRFAFRLRASAGELERRYLFAVAAVIPQLQRLQLAGTGIWLVPSTVISREAAREGPADTYDVRARCLRVGTVAEAIPGIDEALAHVGSPRESSSSTSTS